jgi:hypothetical protein
MSVIPELGRLRQEDFEFEASLDYKEKMESNYSNTCCSLTFLF